MSEHRILLIESPSRLTLNLGRLRIQREGREDALVLPEDIAVLVLHHPAIMISGPALERLAAGGAIVLLTDERHLPSGVLLPWLGGVVAGSRLRQQIALDGSERARRLWATIVAARIGTQAANLHHFQRGLDYGGGRPREWQLSTAGRDCRNGCQPVSPLGR